MKQSICSEACKMNLFSFCLVPLLITSSSFAYYFPRDLKPNLILSLKDTSALSVFKTDGIRRSDEILDIQFIELIDGKILIGSRNAFYVVSQSSFAQATGGIAYDQIVRWKPSQRSLGGNNTEEKRLSENKVRLMRLISNRHVMLVCGANAQEFSCRKYQWTGSRFTGEFEKLDGESSKISQDESSSFAFKYSDGYIFMAIKNGHQSFSSISRVRFKGVEESQKLPLPNLQSTNSLEVLNGPSFIGMIEVNDKIFVFFKEIAMETVDSTDKVVVSRVAQVCKNDLGGTDTVNGKWTSFFKARLNCSVPGASPFYFNELQHITEAVLFDGKPTVFAVFTTPENSITGAAVCAFTVASIEAAMSGLFRKPRSNRKDGWKTVSQPSAGSPTNCQVRRNNEMMDFIKEYHFMAEGVQPVTPFPLAISTQSRYSSVTVELNKDLGIAMLYIGTADGKLLKLTTQQQSSDVILARKIELSEVWDVFNAEVCIPKSFQKPADEILNAEKSQIKRVQSIVLLSEHILVAFKHCVISVPKKACWYYKCEKSCSQSGNPYCGWSSGYCIPVSPGKRESYDQDLFKENTYNKTCESDSEILTQPSCSTLQIALPLVLGLTVVFSVVLLIVICCERRRKKYCGKARLSYSKSSQRKTLIKGQRALLVRHKKDDPLRVTIEATTPIEPSIVYDRPKIGSPQPLNNLNMNCNYGSGHSVALQRHIASYKEQTNSSCDDTEWSEEFEDSNYHLTGNAYKHVQPRGGRKDIPFYPNQVEQNHSSSRLKSHSISSPSRVRLGTSSSSNYGSLLTHKHAKDSKYSVKSRIVTNPNYLPVTPCVSRVTNTREISTAEKIKNVTSPELTTFSSKWEQNEKAKLVLENNEFDFNFPRPPSCVLKEAQNLAAAGKPKSTKLLPVSNFGASTGSSQSAESRKHSISSSKLSSSLSPDDILAPSYAGSTTSGFVSSSPQDPILSPSSRKAMIVAKGILSAQSTLASPNMRKGKKKKRKSVSENEHIYDEPFNPSSFMKETEPAAASRDFSSFSGSKDKKEIIFPSPEFIHKSEDESSGEVEHSQGKLVPAVLALEEQAGVARSKKRIFRNGKSGKNKFVEGINDESFKSPAFDQDPEVPIIEGWQEISYNPRYSTLQSKHRSKYFDDSCLTKAPDHFTNNSSPFYTMRPKNRLRNKMPKLRNTNKEWSTNNNPLPVPTPAIPDLQNV